MKLGIILCTLAIGLVGIIASCVYMENPWGIDELYYGYPLLWLNTSKSLLISFPPIPLRVNVLWVGFVLDMLLYSSGGLVVSYLVFTLRENMKLLRFLIKSGVVFFVGSFMVLLILGTGARFPSVVLGGAFWGSFFFSAIAAPACTIIYGFYRLFKKRKAQ